MKQAFAILSVLALVLACGTQKRSVATASADSKNDTVRIANDSLQYEVIITDPGFSSWLASRAYPRHFYSQTYLEGKNRIWVNEYNNRVVSPVANKNLYEFQIDYQPHIDYGYEVNYLLYNYFVFFQNRFNQRLGGRVPDR